MYSNILVPVDLDHKLGIRTAFNVARLLADEGAKITALHVLEEIPTYIANEVPDDLLQNRKIEARAELQSEIGGEMDVTPVLVSGHAGRTIVDYAADKGADCIIVASHRPELKDYFLGSTANRVVRHAPCAVHVIR